MLAEFRRRHPGGSYTIGTRRDLEAPGRRGFYIDDRPQRMATWEALVQEYDVPPMPTEQAAP
jgi:hypothetical protein